MKKNNGFGGRSQCGERRKRRKREKREKVSSIIVQYKQIINIFHLRPLTVCKTKICSREIVYRFRLQTNRSTDAQTDRQT